MTSRRASLAAAPRADQQRSADATAPPRWLGLARAGWVVAALLALGIFAASIPGYVLSFGRDPFPGRGIDAPAGLVHAVTQVGWLILFAAVPVCLGLAGLLFWRKPGDLMALFVSFYLLLYGIIWAGPLDVLDGLITGADFLHSRVNALHPLAFWWVTLALLALFPTGRFVPSWTRWLVLQATLTTPLLLTNTFQWSQPLLTLPTLIYMALTFAAAGYAQIYRYRHVSSPTERQQTKWAVFGLVVAVLLIQVEAVPFTILVSWPVGAALPGWILVFGLYHSLEVGVVPLTLTVAVLHYRVFVIDLLIRRTLVYGGLTTILGAVYVALILGGQGVLQALTGQRGQQPVFIVVSTLMVAALFNPLRRRLQRIVDRLLFGERDNPYAVLSRLGRRLETALAPDTVLPAFAETVAQALKLPSVAIAVKEAEQLRPAAAYGLPSGEVITFPLTYQSELVGQLSVSPRAPDEPFTDADKRLLENIAHQAGIAVHATRLAADLQRSRERLVTAREEERRRLRRDLHDGLGPTLAGLTLKVGAIRNLLAREPATAERLLAELGAEIEAASADIRRLAYSLRPPALDELGLVGALRAQAEQYAPRGGAETNTSLTTSLRATVEAPDNLPPLPAAVEVAAFRIACEALTNAARHAAARTCRVRIWVDGGLQVETSDDGIGLPSERRAGVGLLSMRERAEELGGTCEVGPGPAGGTRVVARLPLARE